MPSITITGSGRYVVPLTGYTPSVRYDGDPWTTLRVEESDARTGPWTTVGTGTLTPADADPTDPATWDITVKGTAGSAGWLLVTFLDADTNEQPTDPVHYGAAPEDLTSVAAVRRFLQKEDTDTVQDTVIQELVTRASRAVMSYCGVEFRPTAATSHAFIYRGGRRLSLAPYVTQAVTSVAIDTDGTSPTTLTATDWALRPKPPRDGVYRWLRLPTSGQPLYGAEYPGARDEAEREVTVTGTFGYQTIPDDVEHWTIVTVAEWLRLNVQAFSTTLNIDAGLLERPEALPSAVRAGLAHYSQVSAP